MERIYFKWSSSPPPIAAPWRRPCPWFIRRIVALRRIWCAFSLTECTDALPLNTDTLPDLNNLRWYRDWNAQKNTLHETSCFTFHDLWSLNYWLWGQIRVRWWKHALYRFFACKSVQNNDEWLKTVASRSGRMIPCLLRKFLICLRRLNFWQSSSPSRVGLLGVFKCAFSGRYVGRYGRYRTCTYIVPYLPAFFLQNIHFIHFSQGNRHV